MQKEPEENREEESEQESFENYTISLVNSSKLAGWSMPTVGPANRKQIFRTALVASFINGWFGSDAIMSQNMEAGLNHWESPKTLVEEGASDTLGMLQLASQTGDARVLLEARQRHSAIGLSFKGDFSVSADLDSQLAATSILMISEIYAEVCNGFDSWAAHLHRISTIIGTVGHSLHGDQTMRVFFQQFRHCSLLHSLVCGHLTVNERVWRICSNATLQENGEELVQLAFQILALLEAAEIIQSQPFSIPSNTRINELRSRLLQLELDLVSCVNDKAVLDDDV